MADERRKRIFFEAIRMPESERTEFLERECSDDPETLAELGRLLRAHERAGEFLGAPEVGARNSEPDEIGGYRIVGRLGEGGFGVVYLAEQERPVRRKVALKVVRPEMANGAILARFELERRALERMTHPHIATVLDAGTTPEGQPFFVLEHVEGEPITRYCDARRLDLRARCELLRLVCLAVHHAHERGVIHRDVKPSNVLVTEVDGRPVPKVIDFGLAKAVRGSSLGEESLTLATQVVGTPQYMSPEQLTFGESDVDTRTDVYSLGALAYEVLTGHAPVASEEIRGLHPLELQRRIRESVPPRPSLRVLREGGDPRAARSLSRALKGDLDWIVGRAMEKERERRYASAAALASDLRRHLAGEAVEAGPPSRLYRLRKLVGRNRALFAALVAVSIALVTVAVVSLRSAERSRRDSREARRQLAKYEVVADFAERMLVGLDPAVARGADTTLLRRMLDEAAGDLGEEGPLDPEVEVRLRLMIGQGYLAIARTKEAAEQLEEACAVARRELGAADPSRLEAEAALGSVAREQGRLDEALEIFSAVAATSREAFGGDDRRTLQARTNLGVVLGELGRLEETREVHADVLARRIRVLGEDHPDTMASRNNLAEALGRLGRREEAAGMFERVLAHQLAELGASHPRTMATMNNLALTYQELGRGEDALQILERLMEIKRSVLPPGHASLLVGMNNLASLYGELGDPDRAVAILEEVLGTIEGPSNARSLTILNNLGTNLARAGRKEEALKVLRRAAEGLERVVGAGHPNTTVAWAQVASLEQEAGRDAEALAVAERALAAGGSLEATIPGVLAGLHRTVGRCLSSLGRGEEATAAFERALDLARRAYAERPERLRSFVESLLARAREDGDEEGARRWAEVLEGLPEPEGP